MRGRGGGDVCVCVCVYVHVCETTEKQNERCACVHVCVSSFVYMLGWGEDLFREGNDTLGRGVGARGRGEGGQPAQRNDKGEWAFRIEIVVANER